VGNQNITIKYDLSETDWRIFYNAYYKADKRFKLRFVYGTGSWIIGVAGLLGLFENSLIAFGMIAFGLYCVFARQFLVNSAVKKLNTPSSRIKFVALSKEAILSLTGNLFTATAMSNRVYYCTLKKLRSFSSPKRQFLRSSKKKLLRF